MLNSGPSIFGFVDARTEHQTFQPLQPPSRFPKRSSDCQPCDLGTTSYSSSHTNHSATSSRQRSSPAITSLSYGSKIAQKKNMSPFRYRAQSTSRRPLLFVILQTHVEVICKKSLPPFKSDKLVLVLTFHSSVAAIEYLFTSFTSPYSPPWAIRKSVAIHTTRLTPLHCLLACFYYSSQLATSPVPRINQNTRPAALGARCGSNAT